MSQSLRIVSGEKDQVKVSTAINQLAEKFDRLSVADINGSAWTTFTPTITAGSGTLTAKTVNSARYQQVGKIVHFQLDVTITTNGTGATSIISTLPVTGSGKTYVVSGRENLLTGKMLQGIVGTTSVTIFNYDNTYPGGSGSQVIVSGTYESA